MTNAKQIITTLILIPLAFLAIKKFLEKSPSKNLPLIAITQIVEHPALDAEREGVIIGLNKAGFIDKENIQIVYQCAQGNQAIAAQIAQHLAGLKPKVIVAISTPSAQSVLCACQETSIPIVFTAVTDPIAAKLVTTFEPRPEAITGVQDFVPIPERINFICSVVKNCKRIGVIYNSGEINSSTIVQKMKEYVQGKRLEIVEATASKSSEVSIALNSLLEKVDVLYIPNDNTAVSAIATIVQWGDEHKIPILTSDTSLMDAGIFAAKGYNHELMGEVAGNLAARILNGEFAGNILVQTEHPLEQKTNQEITNVIAKTINSF